MVRIHAQTILPATPHLTADRRLIEPTPMIAPVIVCVVLTGTPRFVAVKSEIAPAVSAANPPTGCSFVILDPIVWMMRHPPERVPSAIAAWAASTTHKSILNAGMYPPANSAPAMIPIVFCASFPPCPRLYAAADTSCRRLNHLSTRPGDVREKTQRMITISRNPRLI